MFISPKPSEIKESIRLAKEVKEVGKIGKPDATKMRYISASTILEPEKNTVTKPENYFEFAPTYKNIESIGKNINIKI